MIRLNTFRSVIQHIPSAQEMAKQLWSIYKQLSLIYNLQFVKLVADIVMHIPYNHISMMQEQRH